MEGMNKFQLTFLIICGIFIVVGVAVFAIGGLSGGGKDVAQATIWGTVSSDVFTSAMIDSGLSRDKTLVVQYVQKNAATFDEEFVEALAAGVGPDLFFVSNKTLVRNASKIYPIPYESYSLRDFQTNFAEVGEVFLAPQGVLALPLSVDPLVLYWNRDMLSNVAVSVPPSSWSEFYDLTKVLTKRDTNFNITQSIAPLGEFANVTHATEFLSLLMMQAGSPIMARNNQGLLRSALQQPPLAADRALNFFTEFSNPSKTYYSWNRSLPMSKNFFLAGSLAFYPGFASEAGDLRAKNPNLNFDVAAMPQSTGAGRIITYGDVTGLAIVKNSKNPSGAFRVAQVLTSPAFAKVFADKLTLPPVRRDLLAVRPPDAFRALFYAAAIQARTWPMPDAAKTPNTFKEMVESVTGGRNSVAAALTQAGASLDLQLSR